MIKRRWWLSLIVLVLLVGLVLALALPLYVGGRFAYWIGQGERQHRANGQQSLKELANGDAVLAGCREMLAKAPTYRPNPEWHGRPTSGAEKPDPEDPTLPAAVRSLKPKDIAIDPGKSVTLEFGGGGGHYGLRGYAQGEPGDGDRQIVPGLWYYQVDE